MICPSCKNVYEGLEICPLCKTPATEKINTTKEEFEGKDTLHYLVEYYSKKYYTVALEHSRKRQIYFAIRNLNKSLFFESNNKDARNLLGLCYFETGRIGDASKQFLLSCFIDDKDNLAEEYLSEIEKMISDSDKYDISIECYNKALEFVKNKNISLAVNQLRIAVAKNDKFIDAYLLLALCCIMRNNLDEARVNIDSVLKIDIENPIALKYLSEIKLRKGNSDKRNKDNSDLENAEINRNKTVEFLQNKHNNTVYEEVVEKNNYSLFLVILSFILGVTSTYFLSQIYLDSNLSDEKSNLKTIKSFRDENQSLKLENNEYSQTITTLQEQIASLEEEVDKLEKKIPHKLDLDILIKALDLYNNNENILAANMLLDINIENLTKEDMQVFDKIKEGTAYEAANYYYEEGFISLENSDYENVIDNLEKSIAFNNMIDNNDVAVVDAYYWVAKAYLEIGKKDTAIDYFKYIINNYDEYSRIDEIIESVNSLEQE